MTNAEARFSKSLRPRKPEGSLGRTAQDVHLDSHTAPELWGIVVVDDRFYIALLSALEQSMYTIQHGVTWGMVVWCTQNLRRDGCSFMGH